MSTTLTSENTAGLATTGLQAGSFSGSHCGSSSGSSSGAVSDISSVGSADYLTIAPVVLQQVSVGMQQLSDALSVAISVAEIGAQGLDVLTQLSLATPELYPVCRSFYEAVEQTVQQARSTNDLIAETAHATTLLTKVVAETDHAIAEALRA